LKPRLIVLLSLLISLVVATWATWPLARVFHEGMPSSNRPEVGGPRYMIPGDHLQFLYQLWMFADALEGKTPLFYHVYEFNQGNDRDRYELGTYYFPVCLLYTAGHLIGGQTVGWNLMVFATIWLVYLGTWLLVRRFTASPLTAAVASLPAILLPYFHVALLGGSPTGPGMVWVPVVLLGIDLAVRERKIWAGFMAGVVLFISSWVDLHVFFFMFLATPAWGLVCVAFAAERDGGLRRLPWRRMAVAVAPILVMMVLAYLQTSLVKHSLVDTLQSQGRTIEESLTFALRADGWLGWWPDNRHNLIYIGIWVTVILGMGLGLLAMDVWRLGARARGRLLLYGLVLAAIGVIALLSLGPNVPLDKHHLVWRALRTLIPPFKMIRQPAKAYCLLGPFLAVALAFALDRIAALYRHRGVATVVVLALAAGCLWDYGRRLDPTICLLDHEQGAYRAVALDATACGRENRALALPIWPGDSHWNSLTEYYSTLYRTKMLNGYRPTVRRQYKTDVFERLSPMNLGIVTDAHLDYLLSKKIGYLIVQEDAFPDKVSPFPVVHTLRALLRQPRLEFLAQDRQAWAFKILPAGTPRAALSLPDKGAAYPQLAARRWWGQDLAATNGLAVVTNATDNTIAARLAGPADRLQLPPRYLESRDNVRYMLTARGSGILNGTFEADGKVVGTVGVAVTSAWSWVELPVPSFAGGRDVVLTLSAAGGTVDVDAITLMAGPWSWLEPRQSVTLPAEAFFRVGYSDLRSGSVHLEAARSPCDVVFWASNLPVRPGRYHVTIDFDTPAAPGTLLGDLRIARADKAGAVSTLLRAGEPAVVDYQHEGPQPMRLDLRFSRNGDLIIHCVIIQRVE